MKEGTAALKDQTRRLIPASDWSKFHNYPAPGGLRHLIFNGKTNGFEKCIRRVGRRVLIDETEFFRWIDEQNQGTANG